MFSALPYNTIRCHTLPYMQPHYIAIQYITIRCHTSPYVAIRCHTSALTRRVRESTGYPQLDRRTESYPQVIHRAIHRLFHRVIHRLSTELSTRLQGPYLGLCGVSGGADALVFVNHLNPTTAKSPFLAWGMHRIKGGLINSFRGVLGGLCWPGNPLFLLSLT